jgi:hypothetical protein
MAMVATAGKIRIPTSTPTRVMTLMHSLSALLSSFRGRERHAAVRSLLAWLTAKAMRSETEGGALRAACAQETGGARGVDRAVSMPARARTFPSRPDDAAGAPNPPARDPARVDAPARASFMFLPNRIARQLKPTSAAQRCSRVKRGLIFLFFSTVILV